MRSNPDDDERDQCLMEAERCLIEAKLALESGNMGMVEDRICEAQVWLEKARG